MAAKKKVEGGEAGGGPESVYRGKFVRVTRTGTPSVVRLEGRVAERPKAVHEVSEPRLVEARHLKEELVVYLPPGTYYVGDPCYVLGDKLYDEVGALVFPDEAGRNIFFVADFEGETCYGVDFRTKYGDGRYDLQSDRNQFRKLQGLPVDSGGIAVLDVRLCDPAKQQPGHAGSVVALLQPVRVWVQDGDLVADSHFSIETSGKSDREEEY